MYITYVTVYDALDIKNYSGTASYIASSLNKQGEEVGFLDKLKTQPFFIPKVKEKFYKTVLNQKYQIQREPAVLRNYAHQIQQRIQSKTQVLTGPSSIPFSLLDTKKPIVIWTDAVFSGLLGYYPSYSNLCAETIRNGHAMEKAALERASLVVYSSAWAANIAMDVYQVPQKKIRVLPYGANIETEYSSDEVKKFIKEKPTDECNLLFIGVEWERKGGDKALEIAKYLHSKGVNVTLNIVGTTPPVGEELPPYVKVLGFISKSTPEGRQRLSTLIANSHFLILPTQADCTPIVFAEFNSFGIPVITTNTGGIPTVVNDHVNGLLCNVTDGAEVFGDKIISVIENRNEYENLSLSSFNQYNTRLNWRTATKNFVNLIEEIL